MLKHRERRVLKPSSDHVVAISSYVPDNLTHKLHVQYFSRVTEITETFIMASTEPQAGSVDVVIVGGGIIGLVLTVGLLRVGAKVKVYEQAQGFREIGAGIAFTANAIRCMNLIDPAIPVALRSSGSVATSNGGDEDPNDYLRWIDGYDRQRDDPSLQQLFFKLNAGYRGFEGCRRDQFLEALVKVIPPGVIELKKRLETVHDNGSENKLLLTFQDGTTAEADAGAY